MAVNLKRLDDSSIEELAIHCNTELDILLGKIGDQDIVESRLSDKAFIELKNALISTVRNVEKVKAAMALAEHDTLWRRDDEDSYHDNQRREYFHGVAPGGRL